MARNPLPRVTTVRPGFDQKTAETDLQAAEQLAVLHQERQTAVAALAQELGYEGELTEANLETEIRFYQRRSVEAVLELGKRLLLLKEKVGHGEFILRLEPLSLHKRMAQRFMSATIKFAKSDKKSLLALPGMNQAKLLELVVLDDEEIDALTEGGPVRGIPADEVECMSASELRAAFRKAKREKEEEAEAARRIREARDTTINRLQADNDRLQRELAGKPAAEVAEPTPAMREATALEALNRCALALVNEVDVGLRRQLVAVQDLFGEELPPNHATLAMQQAITQVIQAARVVAADHGIVLPLSTETPQELAWLANMEELDTLAPEVAAERMGGGVFGDDTDALAAEGWALLDADETAGGNHVQ